MSSEEPGSRGQNLAARETGKAGSDFFRRDKQDPKREYSKVVRRSKIQQLSAKLVKPQVMVQVQLPVPCLRGVFVFWDQDNSMVSEPDTMDQECS